MHQVTPGPTPALDLSAPEGLSRRVSRLVDELAELLQQPLAPADFYAEYLKRVLAAVRGVAGAVWLTPADAPFRLQYQVNLAEVGLDKVAHGRACHAELLRQAAEGGKPLWMPPRSGPDERAGPPTAANLTGYAVLFAPVTMDGETVGVVEVWQDFYPESQTWKPALRLLGEVSGFVAAFLHRHQLRQLQEQQQLWVGLEAFLRRVYGSLAVDEVAHLVANEGRRFVGCDGLSVAVRKGDRVSVAAVSGAGRVDPRSRLVDRLQQLCRQVLLWGEKLVYHGTRDEALPPAVLRALDGYLAQSPSRTLVVLPLRDGRDARPGPARAVLVAEHFDTGILLEQIEDRLTLLAPHTAAALHNAVAHTGTPLSGVGRWLVRGDEWLASRGWVKLLAAGAAVAAVIAALVLVPAPLRLDARGQLLPRQRLTVFAPVTGKVIEVKAQNGERVVRGQELLFLEDLDTHGKIEALTVKVAAAEHRLAVLAEQLARPGTDEERDALVKERINQRYELRKATAERDVLLQGSRTPQRTPVPSPLAGKVLTFDAREGLLGKTVKPGDPLLRVAGCQGAWEVVLQVPEEHIAQVREGLHRSPDGAVAVDLLLSSQPNRTYRGRLVADGLAGETTLKDNKVVLPARVEIADAELAAQLETLPVGVEVRARVHCGPRAVGYVWFGGLLEFLYERLWF
ncbi:MAG: HlyD family efflux transporter periplasmic adaptor subunit [Gemmataceae bacterium]